MSFGSTIVLTVNAVAKTLNRVNQDNYGSEYLLRETLQEFRLKIRHSKVKSKSGGSDLDRHNIEVVQTVFAVAGVSDEVARTVYMIFMAPYNDNLTSVGYLTDAFVNYIDSATVQSDLATWQN